MPPSIRFVAGSLAGSAFVVADAVGIGRSRSCAIRPAEPDVSGHHAVVSPRENGLLLEVSGRAGAVVDGRAIPSGSSVPLAPGACVRFGSALTFEVLGDAPGSDSTVADETAAADGTRTLDAAVGETAAADETAVADATRTLDGIAGAAGETEAPEEEEDGDETRALETQAATPAELERLRGLHLSRRRRAVLLRGALVSLAFLAALGVSLWRQRAPETERLQSPRDEKGNSLRTKVDFDDPGPDVSEPPFLFVYGGNASVSRSTDAAGRRWTSVGGRLLTSRGRDVDFPVRVCVFDDPDGLRATREERFRAWLEAVAPERNWTLLDEEPPARLRFLGGERGLGPGVPYRQWRYKTGEGGVQRDGRVAFFRAGRRCYAVCWELESAVFALVRRPGAPGRSLDELLVCPPSFVETRWEGAPDSGLAPAAAATARSPIEWEETETRLREALVAAALAGETTAGSQASAGLAALRRAKDAAWKDFWARRVDAAHNPRAAAAVDAEAVAAFRGSDDRRRDLLRDRNWWKK